MSDSVVTWTDNDTLVITSAETLQVWASYQGPYGPWEFELVILGTALIDSAYQDIGMTLADYRAWIYPRWSGSWVNVHPTWRDSIGTAPNVALFVGGQYENTWPLTHQVGRLWVQPQGPWSKVWIHTAPHDTCNVLYQSWLDANEQMRPVTIHKPSVAYYCRWLRSHPGYPPQRIGADTLSHWSSYKGGPE